MDNSSRKMIAMTNVDSWIGYCSAFYVAQELEKSCRNVELVCLARNTQDLDRLKKLKNVHIRKVDYEDERCLEDNLRDVHCTILIPENEERRAKYARNVLSAMKRGGSNRSCLLYSVEGAESSSSDLKEISSFHEIERDVKEHCDHYVILRNSFINQAFLLWGPSVRDKSEFLTTTNKDSVMTPIDATDIIQAVGTIVTDYCRNGRFLSTDNRDGDRKNRIWTLTGPQKISMERFVQELSKVTGREISLKRVSRDDLRKELENSRGHRSCGESFDVNRCHQLILSHFDTSLDPEIREDLIKRGERQDHPHDVPTKATINLILDELELVKKGESGFISVDLEKLIGNSGKEFNDFLRKQKDEFRRN